MAENTTHHGEQVLVSYMDPDEKTHHTVSADRPLPVTAASGVVLGAGSAVIGKVGIDQTTPGTTNAVQPIPGTVGGCSLYRNLDLGTTGVVVKASAGQLYALWVANQANAARYLKAYNKATAPTQADTPVFTIPIPALAAGTIAIPTVGDAFSAGISLRASTAIADNDTGAPSPNDVVVKVSYK